MAKIIGGVVVLVLLVVGFWVWQSKQAAAPTDKLGMAALPAPANDGFMDKGLGVVSSIKDAMGLGQTMQCTFASGDGDALAMRSSVVVDGQKFKSTTVMKDMTAYAVFDGETQYSWTSQSKQGMKLSKECLAQMTGTVKDMAAQTPTQNQPAPAEDLSKSFDMAKNVQCEAASAADFTLPTDIVFTDQCAMMEQSMKILEQMKDKMPAGVEIPVMPNAAY